LNETEAAAATRSIVLVPAPARSLEALPRALQRVLEEKADALIVFAQAICHRMIRAARAIIADARTFQKPLTPSVSGYRNEFF
jgi:hypothetical protein